MIRLIKKSILAVSIFLVAASSVEAQKVNLDEASVVARDWVLAQQASGNASSSVEFHDSLTHNGLATMYRYTIKPLGFVWVSADRNNAPVLAYSFESSGTDLSNNLPAQDFLSMYQKEIVANRDNPLKSKGSHPGWNTLSTSGLKGMMIDESVEPMMQVTWGQGSGYNKFTPENTPTGCVAVAMVQVMRHWAWPDTCHGQHSYTHSTYGDFAVDFDTVSLIWDDMPYNQPNDRIAHFMLNAGIALHMNYAPGGSGASTGRCRTLLKDNFSYSGDRISFQSMSDYGTVKNWVSMVKNELINGRPIIYRGSGTGGHAFDFDGFNGEYFHVNWGWSGSSNGYFLVTSLSHGSSDFSEAQGCVKGIYPDTMMMWDRPYNLIALAGDNKVALDWTGQYHRDLQAFNVYRDGELIGESVRSDYTDNTAENGVTYSYSISTFYHTDSADYVSERTPSITVEPANGFGLPFEQTFEDGHPGWQISGGRQGFNWGTASNLDMGTDNHEHFVGINSGTAGNNVTVSDYMISNGFDFSNMNHIVLSFDYILKKWQQVDHLYLMYRIFGDNDWVKFHELDKTLNYQDWTHFQIYLPDGALTENVQIAFYYTDGGKVGYGAGIDNIRITEITNPGVPDFSCDQEETCVGSAVIFTDQSSGTRDSYSWDFGTGADPRYANTEGPHTVVYKSSGTKTATLILNDLDEITQKDIVNIVRPPNARFSKTINYKTVTFKNTSSNAIAYMWDFGDGIKVTQPDPIHVYALSGDYKVKLIAINYICESDTIEYTVKIHITGIDDQNLETSFSIYPNPVEDNLYLDITLSDPGKLEYSIISLTGQTLMTKQQDLPAGYYHEVLDMRELPTGVYYLQIRNNQKVSYRKIVLH
ncbi:MAG: C10 family peptidase [Bacteroidales bacterium]|nr:C10 family peptidase [Bacteroidales bacterium]